MANAPANLPRDDPNLKMAAERTLLAWIRTGLAMMGFGFLVARFGLFLRELTAKAGQQTSAHGWSIFIGAALILLGVIVTLTAAGQHAFFLRRLKRGLPPKDSSWSLAIIVAVLLAAVGVAMTAYLALLEW